MLGLSRAFSIPCPLQLFAPGIFIAWGIGLNLWTQLQWVIESSCFAGGEDSTRCLVDSWDSTLQPWNSFLEPFGMQLPPQPLSCCQLRAFLLHFMAATGLSTFLLAFFESFFVILVIRINGSKCLPVVEHVSSFGFSFFHSCFSRLWAVSPIYQFGSILLAIHDPVW